MLAFWFNFGDCYVFILVGLWCVLCLCFGLDFVSVMFVFFGWVLIDVVFAFCMGLGCGLWLLFVRF